MTMLHRSIETCHSYRFLYSTGLNKWEVLNYKSGLQNVSMQWWNGREHIGRERWLANGWRDLSLVDQFQQPLLSLPQSRNLMVCFTMGEMTFQATLVITWWLHCTCQSPWWAIHRYHLYFTTDLYSESKWLYTSMGPKDQSISWHTPWKRSSIR